MSDNEETPNELNNNLDEAKKSENKNNDDPLTWDDDPSTLSDEELKRRIKLLDRYKILQDLEHDELMMDLVGYTQETQDNRAVLDHYTKPPNLVSSVREIIELEPDELEDPEAYEKGELVKKVVIKTSTRVTYFLPQTALVDMGTLNPGDLIGVEKTTKNLVSKLPDEYDPRVKVMELDEKPQDTYADIGGYEEQVQELKEAIVMSLTHKDSFIKLGITPPKGCLMYGPPGVGKTLLARACAAETDACFLKLAGPQLVQMYIGDGAQVVREAFQLAREKAPTIIFIDEIDAVGSKRTDSEKAGDREVKRTMLELLNQLDGFTPTDDIKVLAATNRVDILDPALIRSGRLDRKIEFPLPDEETRVKILKIHSKKLAMDKDVDFGEIARSTEDFNGAEFKALCVEAAMLALRREAPAITHEDLIDAILEVKAKKKFNVVYHS